MDSEAYQLALYTQGQYRGTSVSCRYALSQRLDDVELRRTVTAAIAQTILQHPTLQAGIINADSKKPTWVKLERLNMKNHISWRCLGASDFETSFQEIVISQLDATFPELETQPGWHIVIMHKQQPDFLEILFTWNHPHGDGMSGKKFHEDLHQNLIHTKMNEVDEFLLPEGILKLPESMPNFPPPIEDLVKLPITPVYTLKALWKEYGPIVLNKDPSQAHWAPIRTSPYKTQFRVFSVENAVLSKVLAVCRQKKTTLTGLFQGLAVVSLVSRLDPDIASALSTKTAVDQRRFLTSGPDKYPWLVPERTIGNYVTVFGHHWSADLLAKVRTNLPATTKTEPLSEELLDQVWFISAKARQEVHNRLDMGVKNDIVGLMRFVGDWRTQAIDTAKKPREYSVFITNLGGIGQANQPALSSSSEQDGGWSISRAQFSLSAEVTSAALMISIMSAVGGQLCVGVTWQDCVMSTAMGEGFFDDLRRWFTQIGGSTE
ncbi:alcohol acetyltransferase-domain-containing protein [Annulohypoxylon stygium]|nr:alcohol acetyltransferase-domain-containing protein [Annulohypoxylon stygium]